MSKIIGFTGTRSGMNNIQQLGFKNTLNMLINEFKDLEFHHGDCVGADADAHNIVESLNIPIIIHPGHPKYDPDNTVNRAFCKSSIILPSKGFLERNRDIVNGCDILIACPATKVETVGGTWYTINYARKINKHIIIVHPS